jgi:hypothetical protein
VTQGIAARLGIRWPLSEKLADAARLALECGEEGCQLPVYATVTLPTLGKASAASKARPRFKEVRRRADGMESLLGG